MSRRWEIGIGLTGLVFAIVALTLWFPNDIKGGFIEETISGRQGPGDAFFPILLTCLIGLLGLLQIVRGLISAPDASDFDGGLTGDNLIFLAKLSGMVLVSLTLMYWLGPVVVRLSGSEATYRQLIDTAPYKYIGFATAGGLLTFALICWMDGRPTLRAALISVALITVLILIFDVALSNIQLPPNADH